MEATPRPNGGKTASVLLIEDDAELAEALTSALQADSIGVLTCSSGEEALRRVRLDPCQLVLLDLGLPNMDGFTVLRELRADPATRHTPVIILTARNALAEKLRGFELGACDYVTKPFEMVELRARLRSALAQEQLKLELKRSNEALEAARLAAEESARAKADFLANMSHEIRTPMNGVIAMTGLLLQTDLAPDQRDYVETIRTSGESLVTIINDILNFSKIASGKLELEDAPFSLRSCIEEALDLLATRAAEKRLDLGYRCASDIPELVGGDVTRLRQILVNLVGNAVKFTSTGEVFVDVRWNPQGTEFGARRPGSALGPVALQFSVRDTGIGIPADRVDRLFQSFSQVDSSISRQYGGTGLGLAISRGLVELMGGQIWVESTLGHGTTFHFSVVFGASVASVPVQGKPIPALVGREILIVEDNETLRQCLADQVRQWGLLPVPVASQTEARRLLAHPGPGRNPPAIVLVDVETPDASAEPWPISGGIPILYMNSVGSQVSPPAGPRPGVVLNKPVKPAQLRSALMHAATGQRQETRKPAARPQLDAALANKAPLQILLTDDNVINQKVAVRLLQQLGYAADVANNGLEAIRAIERKAYDLVLMDVQMPELDGLEATRRIRQRQIPAEPNPNFHRPIVIIAMTANAMQGDREKCMTAGMDDYLPKPVRPETLQAALEKSVTLLASRKSAASFQAEPLAEPDRKAPAPAPGPAANTSALPASGPAGAGKILEQPPVDLARLNDFAGGNVENFNELVALYLKQTIEQIGQIREGLASASAEQVSRVAHSCAGASATCGMTAMVPLLRQIERLGHDQDLAAVAGLMPIVDTEFDRLLRYLESHKPIALAG